METTDTTDAYYSSSVDSETNGTDDTSLTEDDYDETTEVEVEIPEKKKRKRVNIFPEQKCCTIAIIVFTFFFLVDIILGISFMITNGKNLPMFASISDNVGKESKISVIPLENSEYVEYGMYTTYTNPEGKPQFVVFDESKHSKEEVLESLERREGWSPFEVTYDGDEDEDEFGVEEIIGHLGWVCRCNCIGRKKNYVYWTRSFRVASRTSRRKAEEDLGCSNPTCECTSI